MTVKKYKNQDDGIRLYSTEVLNHDLENKKGVLVNYEGYEPPSARHPDDHNITQSPPVVNRKIDRLNTLLQGEKQRKRGLYERSF